MSLPTGGVININRLTPESCQPPCSCPPSQCYRWCIKRIDECVFEASNGDITLLADSEKSLSNLIKLSSINQYVNNSDICKCDNAGTTSCSNKTFEPFACISREWIVQVEYRPDCNQYFGSCNPKTNCK
jgi:hypothetical protein